MIRRNNFHKVSMIGYENVKRHFLDVRMRKILGDRWAEDSIKMRLDLVLHGKDRTGQYSTPAAARLDSDATQGISA